MVSVILVFVSLFYGKMVSFCFGWLVEIGFVNVRRRVFVVLIFFWVYKLLVGKGCLELLEDVGKLEVVVFVVGEVGFVILEGNVDLKGIIGFMELFDGVKEVYVVRFLGFNLLLGDLDGGNINGRRFLGICILKILEVIICI